MKKINLLLILLICKTFTAQNYIPFPNDSATWVVSKYCNSPCNTSTDFQPEQIVQHGDSLKNGILYHKLYRVFGGQNSPIFHCFYRENSKKIYLKYPLGTIMANDTSEFVLYDFNLNVGDTFNAKANGCIFCYPQNYAKVILTSITTTTVSYTTGLRSVYNFTGSISNNPSSTIFLTWYEGIGSNLGLLYHLATAGWPITTPSSHPYQYNLACFKRTNSFTYLPGCQPVGIYNNYNGSTKDEVIIYPNPSSNKFTLELTQNSNIQITNSLGQIIYSKTNQENKLEIDCSTWAKGIYFVLVSNTEGNKVFKIVKE